MRGEGKEHEKDGGRTCAHLFEHQEAFVLYKFNLLNRNSVSDAEVPCVGSHRRRSR